MEYIQTMYIAYIEAAYSTDAPEDAREFTDEFCYESRKDCEAFYDSCVLGELPIDDFEPEIVGHDFWRTRNGHDSGFEVTGRPYKVFGPALTRIAKSFSNSESEFKHEVAPPKPEPFKHEVTPPKPEPFKHEVVPQKPEPFSAAKWIFQRETEDGYAELTDAEADLILDAAKKGLSIPDEFVGNPASVYANCTQESLLEEVAALQRVVDAAKGG